MVYCLKEKEVMIMEDTLQKILGELQTNNQKIDRLDKRFDGLEKRFDGLEKNVDGLTIRMGALEKNVEGLTIRMDGFDKRFDHIDEEIKELKKGQAEMKDNTINRVGSYIEVVAKHIDVRFDEMKDTSDDQQRIIHTLAARSVTHESEIYDIKQTLKNG